jgi:hypothetical protein
MPGAHRGEQFVGDPVEPFYARPPISEARPLDRGLQLGRRVTGERQLVPPTA